MVIALNLVDEAEQKGLRVEAAELTRLLGVPVVPTVAAQGKGTKVLLDAVEDAAPTLQEAMREVRTLPPRAHKYLALTLLEGDPSLRGRLLATGHANVLTLADKLAGEALSRGADP